MIKRMYAQLILVKQSLLMAAGFGLLCAFVLACYQSLTGEAATEHTAYSMAERYLILLVLPMAVQLWADVEGRRPGLFMSLPFNRIEVLFYRLFWPMATYAAVAAAVLLYADRYVVEIKIEMYKIIINSLPVAFVLLAAATLFGVSARSGIAGATAAFAWWFMEVITGGRLTKQLYLFAATAPPVKLDLATNRWELMAVAAILALAAGLLYSRNEGFIGD